jgi:hypothetical protein
VKNTAIYRFEAVCFEVWFYLCCRIRMIKRTLWFFVFALMAISCLDQPDCFSLNNNIVGIAFKKLSNNTADTIGLEGIIPEGPNIIYETPATTTFVNVHLNPYANSTTFQIQAAGVVYDLKLDYSSKAQFVSEDCGERFVVTDLKASSLTFDSVRVVTTTPKSRPVAGTNIEVFRCPNTSRIKLRFSSPVTITNVEASYLETFTPASAPVTTLLLPLNTAESTSSVTFTINGQPETLVLNYERVADTLFNACGEQVVISGLTIGSHSFTNATVARATIQDPNQTNLEITL